MFRTATTRVSPRLSLATRSAAKRWATTAPKTPVDPTAPGPMLRYQKNLPKLPVPALSATLQKYLQSVRPLLSDAEFQRTEQAVKEFEAPGGLGQELQERLLAKANDPNVVNWMEDWWLDQAYMGYRDPVVIYVSYFFLYKDDKLRKSPAQRAAAIATAALEFKRQIAQKTLEPEYVKGEPLCMDSFKYMFNNCRIPKKPSDYEATFDILNNNHVVVLRKNRFYVVDTIYNGKQLSTAELQHQFQKIIDQAGQSKGIPIGVLTSDNRDKWTDYRENLIAANPENRKVLEKIESSDFVICLDDSKPVTRDEGSRACWHGDGRNRFFDKPLQFIVFENGKAGFMGEHSCMDGMATCRLNEFVCDGLARNKIEHGPTDIRSDLPEPQELQFDINSQVSKDIEAAETNFENLIKKHELTVLNYQAYGKDLIKKYKCSPDGFAQMVIQLAYYKMFGTSRPTYESAQTRKYQRGRTETARTVTVDSVAFVKAMEDPNVPVQEKISAFRKALKTQGANMADAVNGHGCDRHLFGLKNSLKDSEEKPELFKDPAYAYSSHWYLSTSQLSSEHFDGYGWGQVVNDGFGVAYMVKKHALQFNVASVKDLEVHGTKYVNGTYHFKQCLEDAANELKELMDTEIASEAKL
ncbi:acyltransferase ChoActase/COT/CPT [Rhizopus microsporus var. microsporus]|uniref:Carnitine O-acetyltransferase, mitochondrial n=2 Tax=Rhizopus microsporus TaxID=58291 RepID=A0A2G4T5D6_RHIZD|nr:acyltransferase ChoActase/COT/CPT [Rhizopus microsporus ATCC 52813]ORE03226.1 acyltransferase ChoActase/COT/CPT [Rhizopus microsporus var. microsporus]PHZ16220.1 acyltransferase ChoActase/COT/CPT [Rhizopus microsporus ATCC 52813]